MATLVLVHGAWHGGWCWRQATLLLRAAGHEVYASTLTGLGQRAHPAGRAQAAGVEVTFDRWPKTLHVWRLFANRLAEGQQAYESVAEFVRSHTTRTG